MTSYSFQRSTGQSTSLGVFRTFVGIKSYQHFAFTTDEPGVVQYKKYTGSDMQKLKLLTGELPVAPMPRPDYPYDFSVIITKKN